MRRWGRVLVCAFAALVAIPATSASAHSTFLGADPADGSVLRDAPAVVTLRFSEDVLLDATSVTLTRLGGGTTEELDLSARDGGSTVEATLPALGNGAYVIRFRAVDPADLHTTVGTVSFGIGVAPPPTVSGSQIAGSWWSALVRAATDAMLILTVGGVVVAFVALRRGRCPIAAARLAVIGAAGTALGWVVLFVADVGSVGFGHARWGSLLLGSDPGRRAMVGVELALAIWWSARFMRTLTTGSRAPIARVLLVLGGAFVVTAAFGGHGGVGGNAIVGIVLRAVHIGSFGVWIGAIGVLWWTARRDSALRALWPDVSRLAAVGLALTGASGLLLSGRVVATVTALLGTSYGRAVVGKMAALLVLAALGWFAARRVARGGEPRAVRAELWVAAAAVVLAALLAGGVPAVGERFDPPAQAAPQIVTGDLDDLTVSVQVQPALPGPNLVQVAVLDTRRPSPGPVERVTVVVQRADGEEVARRDGVPKGGVIEWADVDLAAPGGYTVQVTVDRPTSPVPEFAGSVAVQTAPVPRADTVVSTASWAPIAAAVAAAWLVLVGLAAVVVRRRTTRRPHPTHTVPAAVSTEVERARGFPAGPSTRGNAADPGLQDYLGSLAGQGSNR